MPEPVPEPPSEQMPWTEDVDATGLICPLPVLRARKRLAAMAPGAVLRLTTTDPAAAVDVPHFCAEAGHTLLAATEDGAAQVWFIRRRP